MSEEAVQAAEGVALEEQGAALALEAPVERLDIDPVRQAAIVVMVLGNDVARKIFQHLGPKDIERLLTCAENLGTVSPPEIIQSLEDLIEQAGDMSLGLAPDSRALHRIAADALGSDQLAAILGTDSDGATEKLQEAADADPESFAKLLGREHPQVCAVVLSILEPGLGAAILNMFAPELRTNIVARIATLRQVPAHVIAEIAEIVGRELTPANQVQPVQVDGTTRAVDILKKVGADAEDSIFEGLQGVDAALAADLKALMFVFEDILRLHAREVQMILREVDGQKLSIALKRASGELKAFILSNMSSRAAQIVLDDMEALGPIPRSQIDTAQSEIIEVIMRLAEEGSVNTRPDEEGA